MTSFRAESAHLQTVKILHRTHTVESLLEVGGMEKAGREESSESEQWLSVFMSVGVYFAPLAVAAGLNSLGLFSALVLDARAVIK